jgi:outer membrane receptor for ferrienterochelin and colicins
MSDYGGLFNRSKHSANLQVAYRNEKQKAGISARAVYRGRFGFSDINGNNVLDDDREYAAGYVMLNTTLNKEFKKGISMQVGIDNLLDYTNITQLPSIPGRTYFINLNFQLQ